jgi:hypothetical protein
MSELFSLLPASGPSSAIDESRQLYAFLIGGWEVDSTWFAEEAELRRAKGEWRSSWILGGRGVQDLLFAKGAPADQYGTTLRCYDASIDAWRVVWMQPGGGEFVSQIGRKVGDDVVQEGQALDGSSLERWTFSEISQDGFLWRAESSRDGGRTWRLDQEMRGTRTGPG